MAANDDTSPYDEAEQALRDTYIRQALTAKAEQTRQCRAARAVLATALAALDAPSTNKTRRHPDVAGFADTTRRDIRQIDGELQPLQDALKMQTTQLQDGALNIATNFLSHMASPADAYLWTQVLEDLTLKARRKATEVLPPEQVDAIIENFPDSNGHLS